MTSGGEKGEDRGDGLVHRAVGVVFDAVTGFVIVDEDVIRGDFLGLGKRGGDLGGDRRQPVRERDGDHALFRGQAAVVLHAAVREGAPTGGVDAGEE
eukprot:CAMPEP_0174905562 /NCGR_PEP_ID=MMETSP0167-20121228/53452_1 /TAXON_ID=38298 /ORGANISM="Rhodella maculata, Strain CCMP736" /LENGTH=96 /DNA_ID=CAMNT_0016148541 /DNA_START=96 /DNA_END=382 /DNA_ORIENTATION=-